MTRQSRLGSCQPSPGCGPTICGGNDKTVKANGLLSVCAFWRMRSYQPSPGCGLTICGGDDKTVKANGLLPVCAFWRMRSCQPPPVAGSPSVVAMTGRFK
eukprot:803018-Pelagomonas_calceolata.AAC.1